LLLYFTWTVFASPFFQTIEVEWGVFSQGIRYDVPLLVKVNNGFVLSKVSIRLRMVTVGMIRAGLAHSGFLGVGSQASTDMVPSTSWVSP
jgi:hypothetical protein